MANDAPAPAESRKHYFCRGCGYSPTNRRDWCDKGCGSDFNEMIELKSPVLTYIQTLEKEHREMRAAAVDLYDNRLGHRDDNPQWSSPQYFWKKLGDVLGSLTLKP